jgi:hypothetical protein
MPGKCCRRFEPQIRSETIGLWTPKRSIVRVKVFFKVGLLLEALMKVLAPRLRAFVPCWSVKAHHDLLQIRVLRPKTVFPDRVNGLSSMEDSVVESE